MYFTKLACKDTNSISHTQVRAHFFSKKSTKGTKNEKFFTFHFPLSTFLCTFACSFVRKNENDTRHSPDRGRDNPPLNRGDFS